MATGRQIIDVPLFDSGGLETDRDLLNSKGFVEFKGIVDKGGLSNLPKRFWKEFGGIRGAVFFKNDTYFLLPDGQFVSIENIEKGLLPMAIQLDVRAAWIPYKTPLQEPDYLKNNNTFDLLAPVVGGWIDSELITPLAIPTFWPFLRVPFWALDADGGQIVRDTTITSEWFDILKRYVVMAGLVVTDVDWQAGKQGFWAEVSSNVLRKPDLRNRMIQGQGSSTGTAGAVGLDEGRNATGGFSIIRYDIGSSGQRIVQSAGGMVRFGVSPSSSEKGIWNGGGAKPLDEVDFDLSRAWGASHTGGRFVPEHVVQRAIVCVYPWRELPLQSYQVKGLTGGLNIDYWSGVLTADTALTMDSSAPTVLVFGDLKANKSGKYAVDGSLRVLGTVGDVINVRLETKANGASIWTLAHSFPVLTLVGTMELLPLLVKKEFLEEMEIRFSVYASVSGVKVLVGSDVSGMLVEET